MNKKRHKLLAPSKACRCATCRYMRNHPNEDFTILGEEEAAQKIKPDDRLQLTPGELAFWEMVMSACVASNADGSWKLESMAVYASNAIEERRKIVPIDPRTDALSEVDALLCDLASVEKVDAMRRRIYAAQAKIRGVYKSA